MSDDKKIQRAVKNYLLKNPGFFIQHPELITELEVVGEQGRVTDLTSHQLRSLQKQNQQLKSRISDLVANAQQSESMMNRLFDLLISLSLVDKAAYVKAFVDFVASNFTADHFTLLLDKGLGDIPEDQHLKKLTPEHLTCFSVFKTKSEPLSGRLEHDKVNVLFTGVEDIKSAVVLPIGEGAQFGLMAFASKDEEKFHPNSASDLLQKLAAILAAYLSGLTQENESFGS